VKIQIKTDFNKGIRTTSSGFHFQDIIE